MDAGGATPEELAGTVHSAADYRKRGWGTVGQGSYHTFLLWLEDHLNPQKRNPVFWDDFYQDQATVSAPPTPNSEPKMFPGLRMGMKGQPFGAEKSSTMNSDDLLARSKFSSSLCRGVQR